MIQRRKKNEILLQLITSSGLHLKRHQRDVGTLDTGCRDWRQGRHLQNEETPQKTITIGGAKTATAPCWPVFYSQSQTLTLTAVMEEVEVMVTSTLVLMFMVWNVLLTKMMELRGSSLTEQRLLLELSSVCSYDSGSCCFSTCDRP